eukprot:TRINITY_DN2925_c0_g2::TRINITY_DN2925_c0_g2_i4::g.4073::m.4073 TRINITY_DN2925_c0_g2::TRINITY_DN2925_c0_g2_i4::g.4073  ORF type:complete len:182 (+),score=5.89,Glyco_hydro_14/PF01373.12/0.13 TRINITY_DN2925_c0_g2_i4:197-742(+)
MLPNFSPGQMPSDLMLRYILRPLSPSRTVPPPTDISHVSRIRITPRDLRSLGGLKKDFVFTYADKGANNFVIVCKNHYIKSVIDELESNIGTYSLSSKSETELQKDLMNLMTKEKFATKESKKLPYFAGIVKLHKDPIAFRFLSCSSNVILTPLSIWISDIHWSRDSTDLEEVFRGSRDSY